MCNADSTSGDTCMQLYIQSNYIGGLNSQSAIIVAPYTLNGLHEALLTHHSTFPSLLIARQPSPRYY